MKKIYLEKIEQYGSECYIGKADPRIIVRMATKVEMGTVQSAQRPLNEKRVKEISNYVSDKGILPNTLVLGTTNNTIKIKKCDEIEGLYYTEFPSLESEFESFKDTIDVMDGQHRLYSFLPEIRTIADNDKYDIGFTLYDKPNLQQRRKIFISCNEKQDKVSANLLLWFKEKLNMLSDDEKRTYNIVNKLSQEYPLKGHIIMGAEKIKNGVKSKEVIADLKKSGVLSLSTSGNILSDDQIVSVIRTYLSAWQDVVGFEFSSSTPKDSGVAVKMAGLKYMIYVLPSIWDYSIQCHKKFNNDFVSETLKKMISKFNVEHSDFFTDKELNKYFRDRTMISELADLSINIVKKLGSEDFNPLDD